MGFMGLKDIQITLHGEKVWCARLVRADARKGFVRDFERGVRAKDGGTIFDLLTKQYYETQDDQGRRFWYVGKDEKVVPATRDEALAHFEKLEARAAEAAARIANSQKGGN